MSARRMLKDIPIIGRRPTLLLPLLLTLLQLAAIARPADAAGEQAQASGNKLHPVRASERRLRSTIEAANNELRQLKLDFMEQMMAIVEPMKSDPLLGLAKAQEGSPAALATALMAEQVSDIIVKRHIISRRLVSGIRVAFLKFLPENTKQRLADRFDGYSWLRDHSSDELRSDFPDATEDQWIQLYTLIETRARLRAADDLMALTADNVRRILRVVTAYLMDGGQKRATKEVLKAMARHASRVLKLCIELVLAERSRLAQKYRAQWPQAQPLMQMAGGRGRLFGLLDAIIDAKTLDIQLNQEASALDLPPTITQAIIQNIAKKWLPAKVRQSLLEEREVLFVYRDRIIEFVQIDTEIGDFELETWCSKALSHICKHYAD